MRQFESSLAEVSERKIVEYLLSPRHPKGGTKARFFLRFGFSPSDWNQMAHALKTQADRGVLREQTRERHGMRYVIDGPIEAPDGRSPLIRSVWFSDPDGKNVRFVTAHPLPRSSYTE